MIKFKAVVLEKNKEIQNFIKQDYLNVTSYSDFWAGASAINRISADIVIIDISCFDKTDVFKYISKNTETSVIVVNAEKELKYQIYECGAVDVLIRPYDIIELKYKIDIAAKKNMYNPKQYHLGDLIYEIETGTIKKDDHSIVLPSMQNKIFTLLLNAYYEDRIVKKDEVFDSLIDESSRIQNHIARLRYSLSYIKSRQVVIETVYGKGYKLYIVENHISSSDHQN